MFGGLDLEITFPNLALYKSTDVLANRAIKDYYIFRCQTFFFCKFQSKISFGQK